MFKIGKFMGQVKTEMSKVSWPTKDELVASTVIVLIATFMLALFIGTCDIILSKVIQFLVSGVVF